MASGRSEAIAVCAGASVEYAAVFLGALRAGVAVAPLAPGETAESLAGMLADSGAKLLFVDAGTAATFAAVDGRAVSRVALDGSAEGRAFEAWLAPEGAQARAGRAAARLGVQHHLFLGHHRHAQGHRAAARDALGACAPRRHRYGYGPDAVTLLATPLYSNTTLVVFLPTLAWGGTAVLMAEVRRRRVPARWPSGTASPTPCWCRCSTSG